MPDAGTSTCDVHWYSVTGPTVIVVGASLVRRLAQESCEIQTAPREVDLRETGRAVVSEQKAHDDLMELVRTGRYRATTSRVISFAEIPAALEDLANRQTFGRVVAKP